MKFTLFHGSRTEKSARMPVGGLLLSALSVGGVAATAFWLSKEARVQKQREWTTLEPLDSKQEEVNSMTEQVKKPAPPNSTIPAAKVQQDRTEPAALYGSGTHQRGEESLTDELAAKDARQPSKMVTGGDELRDHDFPLPDFNPESVGQTLIEATDRAEPETVRSGGAAHTRRGDDSPVNDVPTIMDQTLATPDFQQG